MSSHISRGTMIEISEQHVFNYVFVRLRETGKSSKFFMIPSCKVDYWPLPGDPAYLVFPPLHLLPFFTHHFSFPTLHISLLHHIILFLFLIFPSSLQSFVHISYFLVLPLLSNHPTFVGSVVCSVLTFLSMWPSLTAWWTYQNPHT